jgi:hypothetical protein
MRAGKNVHLLALSSQTAGQLPHPLPNAFHRYLLSLARLCYDAQHGQHLSYPIIAAEALPKSTDDLQRQVRSPHQ